ncbi:hypothetical protein E1293_14080 [Actinomadura darangshiensis]|uniref:Uncharacterized protein n=1 Tax=Actinomadura darangshiensis TaxID=705336 RepID=A0A4R5BIY9_9ACTN|nr:DUF5994 family protein [Actinomadura darangshiensis]TDD83814.1 hypothetical protein E1293_14080 [Actinomadura darangshiensis]
MTPRLALRSSAPAGRSGPRQDGSGRTLLDGGWWPRSADPAVELPGLVLALQAHGPPDDHRPIAHILLRTADWDTHPRRLRVDAAHETREVRLSWFDNLPAGQLTAIYADGRRIDLLTIPASTDDATARAVLGTVAQPATGLLAAPAAPHDPAWTEPAAQNV